MPKAELCQVFSERRVRPAPTALETRLKSFSEAEPTFTLEQAIAEAKRCAKATPCLYCEVCELLCPDLAITRDPETRRIRIDLDYCKGCHICAIYCPHNAIEMVLDE